MVNEETLSQAPGAGVIGGAALAVLEKEPPPAIPSSFKRVYKACSVFPG